MLRILNCLFLGMFQFTAIRTMQQGGISTVGEKDTSLGKSVPIFFFVHSTAQTAYKLSFPLQNYLESMIPLH